ncbi:unnamed protein product [Merluccius merluccius]
MSKPGLKKSHWTSRVKESLVARDSVSLLGGAERGEFAVLRRVQEDEVQDAEGDLVLEVEGLSVSGLPLYDVRAVIHSCQGPVRLKTVRPDAQRDGAGCRGDGTQLGPPPRHHCPGSTLALADRRTAPLLAQLTPVSDCVKTGGGGIQDI